MFHSFTRKPALFALSLSLAALGVACNSVSADHKTSNGVVRASVDNAAKTTNKFAGPKANQGTATLRHIDGRRVVDSSGNTFLLNRLVIKGDKQNRTIAVPSYVKDVAKVQIWCAYAEVLLGEATFASTVH